MFRRVVSWQIGISKRIDKRFFCEFSVDGNTDFVNLVRSRVKNGMKIAEVGGGKSPLFCAKEVASLSLRVTGIDMDPDELEQAEMGAYGSTIVSKIENVQGSADHDVVIAQSVFEHVRDGSSALAGAASLLKPGGKLYSFCPSRRAWFAKINMLLPERIKRAVLFGLFPEKSQKQGFPAYYDGCLPEEFRTNLAECGLRAVEFRPYFVSSYFMFFVPLYLFWRLATWPFMKMYPDRYCETFIFVATKR